MLIADSWTTVTPADRQRAADLATIEAHGRRALPGLVEALAARRAVEAERAEADERCKAAVEALGAARQSRDALLNSIGVDPSLTMAQIRTAEDDVIAAEATVNAENGARLVAMRRVEEAERRVNSILSSEYSLYVTLMERRRDIARDRATLAGNAHSELQNALLAARRLEHAATEESKAWRERSLDYAVAHAQRAAAAKAHADALEPKVAEARVAMEETQAAVHEIVRDLDAMNRVRNLPEFFASELAEAARGLPS